MKKFENIRYLKEDAFPGFGSAAKGPLGFPAADDPEAAVFNIDRPESINRINAYLGQCTKALIDPASALRQMQRKLSYVGLDVKIPSRRLQPGRSQESQSTWNEDYDLTFMGGRFGVLENGEAGFKVGYDDNITNKLGYGLKLRLEYNRSAYDGLTTVRAKVIPDNQTEINPPPAQLKPVNVAKVKSEETIDEGLNKIIKRFMSKKSKNLPPEVDKANERKLEYAAGRSQQRKAARIQKLKK